MQWFFDNLLPEEEMRSALAREAKVDASDAWGLLAYYGRESAGALTLLAEGEQEAPERTAIVVAGESGGAHTGDAATCAHRHGA